MIKLNKDVSKKYAYVKSTVIFNISTQDNGDACAVEVSSANCPSITVNGGVYTADTKLYFDGYIADGDTYGGGTDFKKTVHSKSKGEDDSKTFQQYYRDICEDQIERAIVENYTIPYSGFTSNPDRLGVERFMLKNSGYTIPSEAASYQIDFSEEYYNESKKLGIKEIILENAQNTANKYGYTLTEPDVATDIKFNGEE